VQRAFREPLPALRQGDSRRHCRTSQFSHHCSPQAPAPPKAVTSASSRLSNAIPPAKTSAQVAEQRLQDVSLGTAGPSSGMTNLPFRRPGGETSSVPFQICAYHYRRLKNGGDVGDDTSDIRAVLAKGAEKCNHLPSSSKRECQHQILLVDKYRTC